MPASRDLVLGTAGHIDHGKTALVRALTGVDTDRLPDERRRGITIDLGFAALELGNRRLALVDVPGHERFIRNMLAGATGLDLAMLVVAADDSVMPQTREHSEILRLLGLPSGLIALTKCDLAAPAWIDLVEEDVRALVSGTFLAGTPIIRTSAADGRGIDDLKAALSGLAARAPMRADPGPFRLAIDRAFTVPGHGTVVSGTVASGEVTSGDELDWFGPGRPVRVRGLHRHDRPADRLGRGTRAAINLGGVHHAEVARGDEVASPGYLTPSRRISVEVRGSPGAPRPLRHRGRYRLHIGTAEVSASLALVEGMDRVDPASPALAQLHLDRPVVAVHGQAFVLREESPATTLGGGRVLQPVAAKIRRRDGAGLARLSRLRSADPAERTAAALDAIGLAPWTEISLCRDSGVPLAEVAGVVASLSEAGRLVDIPLGPRRARRVPAEVATELESRVETTLARLHEASPRHSAIGRARVSAALAYLGDDALVAGLIERLKARGRLTADSRAVALAGHEPKLSQAERRLKAEIAEAYRVGGMTPPEPASWMSKGNPKGSAVAELLALLCDEERLVHVGPDLYLDFDVAASLRTAVADRLADGSSLTMAGLRDLLATTRKYAVPIGEYLDRVGLTRRDGDVRRLLADVPVAARADA